MKNTNIDKILFEITPEVQYLADMCEKNNAIDKELYIINNVKRGLRDLNGRGVLAGLTNISAVHEITCSKTRACENRRQSVAGRQSRKL